MLNGQRVSYCSPAPQEQMPAPLPCGIIKAQLLVTVLNSDALNVAEEKGVSTSGEILFSGVLVILVRHAASPGVSGIGEAAWSVQLPLVSGRL